MLKGIGLFTLPPIFPPLVCWPHISYKFTKRRSTDVILTPWGVGGRGWAGDSWYGLKRSRPLSIPDLLTCSLLVFLTTQQSCPYCTGDHTFSRKHKSCKQQKQKHLYSKRPLISWDYFFVLGNVRTLRAIANNKLGENTKTGKSEKGWRKMIMWLLEMLLKK